ncbi:hypothetical protein [Acidovorax radicis]|uniref:hypothetical protein n=1 Tax=Acidovorax radicis TaxID=758826 RepID=UPI001CFBC249|nr:hypothetical protein [Acidovorax radicis]UCV00717.1 hypothetical protein KI609_08190 [Acidovorax radicis]
MSDPNAKDPAAEAKQMTAAEAAKRVKRTVVEYVDGKDGAKIHRPKKVAVEASEVLSFRDYGTYVVVVTKDGQKLTDAGE